MENRITEVKIKGQVHKLPIFLPDATRAVTKSIDSLDMTASNVRGAVVNTYHLMTEPGTDVLQKFGGVKDFMNYEGLVVSDSGGWQVFSLIHRSGLPGKITDEGVTFSLGGAKDQLFSPEKSIKVQFDIGSDIIICLDDFTPPEASKAENEATVDRTTLWAKRCKREYENQLIKRKLSTDERPMIFAVVQGHKDKDLRKKSADSLKAIGFDGYGFGGYLIDESGNLDLEMSKYIADLIPSDRIKFALGFGKPWDIASLYKMGWDIFDCTLPTRDARHMRLYTFSGKPEELDLAKRESYELLSINRGKFVEDQSPISPYCSCHTCKNYSRAYINHLFRIKDTSAYRLATIHNLWTYNKVIEVIGS
ncbi:queuine tRNA-ribosyltransferase family protein [candidate division WWE3 bacterium]|nr:queuine tRNA-ribosyltransferase family protein [candidate division WWE3 bacterium]